MTGATAHEIRTPLSTALMALDLLTSTISTSPDRALSDANRLNLLDIVGTVKEGCDTSLGILNQMLTFEKLSVGMMQLEAKLVPLVFHIESNVSMFRFQAMQKCINFNAAVSPEEREDFKDLMVFVDEHKMGQVVRNLLSNALKFTPSGGNISVHMTVEKNTEAWIDTAAIQRQGRPTVLSGLFRGPRDSSDSLCQQQEMSNKMLPATDNALLPVKSNSTREPTSPHSNHNLNNHHRIEINHINPNQHQDHTHNHHHHPHPHHIADEDCTKSTTTHHAYTPYGWKWLCCGACGDHLSTDDLSNKFSATFSIKTTIPHVDCTKVVSLVFQDLPDVEPYGYARITFVDSGPGIDEVSTQSCSMHFVSDYISNPYCVFSLCFN
jgi:signal transduction histidine kinase